MGGGRGDEGQPAGRVRRGVGRRTVFVFVFVTVANLVLYNSTTFYPYDETA